MKSLITFSLFLILMVTSASAQGLPTATAEDVGLSSERLARIKPLMQGHIDDGTTGGILTMIARRGKIAHLEMVGKRDIANDKPITLDTIFRIYSMSKAITSCAVMTLMKRDVLISTTRSQNISPSLRILWFSRTQQKLV
jgi:CubicO group peptidase (beta-lactamase class C family)